MNDSLLIVYGCIGIATLILFMIYRIRRKDSWVNVVFAHEFMMLLFAALWPVFLPLLLWILLRGRRKS